MSGRIEITKTPAGLYNITITDMKIESEFKIQTDVDHVKLKNVSTIKKSVITFSGRCKNLELICFRGHLNFLNSKISDRLVIYESDLTSNDGLISILTRKCQTTEAVSRNDTLLPPCSRIPHRRQEHPTSGSTVSLHANRNSKIFLSLNDNVPVNIMDLSKNIVITGPEKITKENEFPVTSFLSTGLDKLVLEDLYIEEEREIIRNITDLRVISTRGSTLRINANVKNLFIERSTLSIDISKIDQLEKLTLIDSSPFIYDRNIYQSLSYLRFDKMSVGKNIYLAGKLKTLIIESTNICGPSVLKIDATVINLSIQKSIGSVDVSRAFKRGSIKLCGKEVIELRRDKCSLILRGFKFKSNVEIDDSFRLVKLSETEMKSGRKVILNKKCEYFELESSDVNIDYSKVDDLKCVTFIKVKWSTIKEVLALKTVTIAIFKEVKFRNEFICPANIRVISLRCVKMLDHSVFLVNENCEEITLFNCVGRFDLSNATCLKKFAVIPSANGNDKMELVYPSLENVIDLELAYELSGKYFGDLLTRCNNFRRFTLHELWYGAEESEIHALLRAHDDLYRDIENYEKTLAIKTYRGYLLKEERYFKQKDITTMDIIMNKVFYDSFNYNMRIRVTYLNVEGFELDERNVKMLKNFSNLETLILSSYSVQDSFFLYLPIYLKSLRWVYTTISTDLRIQMDNRLHFTVKGLRNYKHLKNLELDDRSLQADNFFNNLPVCLESLKLVVFETEVSLKSVSSFKKLCLKSFTVELIKESDAKSLIKCPMERDEIRIFIFSQFANFIEFKKLDKLEFEIDGEVMVLNTETYEIK